MNNKNIMDNSSSTLKTRNSVKIVLLNDSKILLMATDDPNIRDRDGKYGGRFWQLIGGSTEQDEGIYDTARRELFEETSLGENDVTFGPVIWQCTFDLTLKGKLTRIFQRFVLAHSKTSVVCMDNLTADEKGTVQQLKWFSLDEIIGCNEIIYPVCLARYLKPVLGGDIPSTPIELEFS